jgi:hypothetical protein
MIKKKYIILDQEQRSRLYELLEHSYSSVEATKRLDSLQYTCEKNPQASLEDARYYLIEDNGRVLAYSGRMPTNIIYQGTLVHAFFVHETLVHPDYRRKGLGIDVHQEVLKESCGLCIGLWANEKLLPLLLKTGWRAVGDQILYRKIISFSGVFKKLMRFARCNNLISTIDRLYLPLWLNSRFHPTPEVTVFRISRFEKEMDKPLLDIISQYNIITCRDSAWLNWKYVDIPYREYTVYGVKKDNIFKGYVALRLETDTDSLLRKSLIVDLLCDPGEKDCFLALISASEQFSKSDRCDYIVCFFTFQPFLEWLKELGYSAIGTKGREHFLLSNTDKIDHPEFALTFANWYLTYGDSDYDMLNGELEKRKR